MLNKLTILKPLISEKSFRDAGVGIFTFIVDTKADKTIIKKEIESLFNVHVTGISTTIIKGKLKVAGKKRQKTKEPDTKKARVKLKTGEKIPLFEVGSTK